jgi:NodT family efflux transporter outer membrane factor (OMF) lipoprotein
MKLGLIDIKDLARIRGSAPYLHLIFFRGIASLLGAIGLLMGTSCSFVPPLKTDDFAVPSDFKESRQGTLKASKDADQDLINGLNPLRDPVKGMDQTGFDKTRSKSNPLSTGPWWKELGDPVLDQLEDRLLKSNISVLQLAAQVRVAQASLKQAEASLFPTLNVNLSASRSANQLSVPKGTSYSLSAPMSWELDVWGRIDALTQVAASNAMASELDLRQAQVSAQALLVQNYVTLLAAKGQEDLLLKTVQGLEKSLSLTQTRYSSGVVSSADVALAMTQLKSTSAQYQDVVLQRKQLEHALATLMGVVPAQLNLEEIQGNALIKKEQSGSRNQPPDQASDFYLPRVPALPENVVLDVLQYRADIQAAKRRVEAANAQLGVARAAFFPPLVLSASAGYRNTDFANLVSAPNQAWSIGPSLVLPFFDGGLRQAAKEGAQAQLDNAVFSYRQVVLNAFQEIEDNLVSQAQLSLSESAWLEAVKNASKNLDVTLAQYKSGLVPYLSVVSVQNSYLSSQRSLLDVQSRKILSWNQLKKNTFVQAN